MTDPSLYVYGGGSFAAVMAWLTQNAHHLGREVPHIIEFVRHTWGGLVGLVVGYAVGDSFGWGSSGSWILGSIAAGIGLFLQHRHAE